jgi:hypothetical protein
VNPKVKAIAGLAAAGLLLVGCNIFNPFDSPTSDAQLLSVARACFDNGDFECAQENYGKLSGSSADIKNSEEAFLAVEQVGAGMGAFISAFGQDNAEAGSAITSIANSIGANASRANRVALFAAYQKAAAVSDTRLKGLTRFVTATALMAEMLAEDAATPGDLTKNDITVNGTTCAAAAAGACLATGACGDPAGSVIQTTTPGLTLTDTLDAVTSPMIDTTSASIEVLNAAITTINDSLSQMGVTNTDSDLTGFTDVFGGLVTPFTAGGGGEDAPCYRQGLVSNGVGR